MKASDIKVGYWVEFKSDIEQGGRVTAKSHDGWLTVENENGFQGGYIGGDTIHQLHVSDVFEVHAPAVKKKAGTVKKATIKRPKAGTVSAQVWEICDDNPMAERSLVILACEQAGINKATAATQYARWKKRG